MATELDVIDAQIALEDLEINHIKAIHGYNILVSMYKNNIDASMLMQ